MGNGARNLPKMCDLRKSAQKTGAGRESIVLLGNSNEGNDMTRTQNRILLNHPMGRHAGQQAIVVSYAPETPTRVYMTVIGDLPAHVFESSCLIEVTEHTNKLLAMMKSRGWTVDRTVV